MIFVYYCCVHVLCIYSVCVCTHTHDTCTWGWENNFGCHFSPSVMWVLGFKLLLAGLYGKLPTCPRPLCWAISQVLEWIFNHCPSLTPSTATKEDSVNVDGTFREFDLKKTSHREHLSPTTHLSKTKRQWGVRLFIVSYNEWTLYIDSSIDPHNQMPISMPYQCISPSLYLLLKP